MNNKKPINSLELFYEELNRGEVPGTIINATGKWLKKVLQSGYYIEEISQLWFDDPEGGLNFNNWVDAYGKGIWGMTQKETDEYARKIVRDFSHLTRRPSQKVIPRAFTKVHEEGKAFCVYLYMRDKEACDYHILFVKKRETV